MEAADAVAVDDVVVAEPEPAQVDGEEPAATCECGAGVGEEDDGQAEDRVEAVAAEMDSVENHAAPVAGGHARKGADPGLSEERGYQFGPHRCGIRDDFDESDGEEHRHGIVRSRFEFEGRLDATTQPGAAGPKHGEDRRSVSGRHDRPEEQADLERDVEEPGCGGAGDAGGDHDADRGQRGTWPEHRSDRRPSGAESAVEEDQGERADTDGLCRGGIVKVEATRAVGAGEHAQREEQQQGGDAETGGELRCEHAREGQACSDEENRFDVHG